MRFQSSYARFARLRERVESGELLSPAEWAEYEELVEQDPRCQEELWILRELARRGQVEDGGTRSAGTENVRSARGSDPVAEGARNVIEGALREVAERDKVVPLHADRDMAEPDGRARHRGSMSEAGARAVWRPSKRVLRWTAVALTVGALAAGALAMLLPAQLLQRWPLGSGSASASGSRFEGAPRSPFGNASESRGANTSSTPNKGLASDAGAEPTGSPQPEQVQLTLTAGSVRVNGTLAEAGDPPLAPRAVVTVGRGAACLSLARDLDVCLGSGSRIRLDEGGAGRRFIELHEGRVVAVLAKRPEERRFAVRAQDIEAVAVGTIFEVRKEPSASGPPVVQIAVAEGRVRVETSNKTPTADTSAPPIRFVDSGERLVFPRRGGKVTRRLEQTAVERLRSSMARRKLWQSPTVGLLQVAADPRAAPVQIDGQRLGPGPVSVLVEAGSHELGFGAVEDSSHEARRVETGAALHIRRVEVRRGETTRVELPPSSVPKARPAAPPQVASSPPAASDLLGRARQQLQAGNHAGAVESYRSLRRHYPESAEAHTVLVTLGQIELNRLGQPAQALRSFSAYLRTGGPLAQEASQGRIRALQALGHRSRERAAIRSYLRRYGDSLNAPRLRHRLEELGD